MSETLNDETTWLVQTLAKEPDPSDAAVGLMVERLRRMEDEARLNGGDRQTLQKLASARRVLGDPADLGPTTTPFAVPYSRQG